MRHLSFEQVVAALNRGRTVEQLLGRHVLPDQKVLLRWISAYPSEGTIKASLHEVLAVESTPVHESGAFDLTEEHGEGRIIGTWQSADKAIADLTTMGAVRNKWVNFGVLTDELNDAEKLDKSGNLELSASALDFLESVEARADPAPWSSWVEGRDGLGGDSFIMVGPHNQDLEDIYLHRDTTTRSNNELDLIALARNYLMPLIEEIRALRLAVPDDLGAKVDLDGVTIWIEAEEVQDVDDFCNVIVTLGDGRLYGLNVWTFDFFDTARSHDGAEITELAGVYMQPPDLFVSDLSRETIEKAIHHILSRQIPDHWVLAETR